MILFSGMDVVSSVLFMSSAALLLLDYPKKHHSSPYVPFVFYSAFLIPPFSLILQTCHFLIVQHFHQKVIIMVQAKSSFHLRWISGYGFFVLLEFDLYTFCFLDQFLVSKNSIQIHRSGRKKKRTAYRYSTNEGMNAGIRTPEKRRGGGAQREKRKEWCLNKRPVTRILSQTNYQPQRNPQTTKEKK